MVICDFLGHNSNGTLDDLKQYGVRKCMLSLQQYTTQKYRKQSIHDIYKKQCTLVGRLVIELLKMNSR